MAICVTPTEWKDAGKVLVFTGFYLMGLDVPRTRLNKTFGNNQRIYITCVQMIVHTLATHLIILPIFVKARGIILSYSYEGAFTFYVNDSEYTVGTREDDHLPRCRVCR